MAGAPKISTRSFNNSMRVWWRFLDQCSDIAPVESVKDLNDIHGALQFRQGISGDATRAFLQSVNSARQQQGLYPLVWVKNERNKNLTNLPSEADVAHIYHALKRKVFATIDRWDAADALVGQGVDWSNCMSSRPQSLPWTRADRIATFAGICRAANHPCPSRKYCKEYLGCTLSSKFFYNFSEVVYGLYPSRDDVQNFLFLFLLRSGWNGGTAIEMICDDLRECLRDHPTSDVHNIIYANKARGNKEQAAIGLKKSLLGAGNLIKILWERSEPLREHLHEQPDATVEIAQGGEDRQKQIAELRRLIQSPWIFVKRDDSVISALSLEAYSDGKDGRTPALRTIIQEINSSNSRISLSEEITLSDFRDAYIAFAYKASGYSWLVAKLAAGHSSIDSLVTYFRKKQWKAYGESRVAVFQNALWEEIINRRVVDPAILRAWVERGEVTDQQRIRWLNYKDRTRVGTGCKDFYRPPKSIAPQHEEGKGCRVQRCTLCRHAVVFDDSVDHLARRLAELIALKGQISLTSWHESSFPLEIRSIETVLEQFDLAVTQERSQHWANEILLGRHMPLSMEGAYGA
jgi:hypothetical protein